MTVNECCARFERAIESLSFVVSDIIYQLSDKIIDMQTDRLWEGLYVNGEYINPYYAEMTINIKKMKGDPYDRVTLRDTGAFYRAIFVKQEGNELLIDSTDSKAESLKGKYGEIFGLTEQNKEVLQNDSADMLIEYIKRFVDL